MPKGLMLVISSLQPLMLLLAITIKMEIQGATGLQVYNSIFDAQKGQIVAENFDVLA